MSSLVNKKQRFASDSKPSSSALASQAELIHTRALKLLSGMLEHSHMTQRMIEQELGYCRGYFNKVLSGEIELKLDHLTMVCLVLEFPVVLFFKIVCENESRPEEIEKYDNAMVKRMKGLLIMIYSKEPERMLKEVGYEHPYQAQHFTT